MVVNSLIFFYFFLVVFFLYYFVFGNKVKQQNWLLLLSSYFFYGIASINAIPIVLIATVIIYYFGIIIAKYNNSNRKKASIVTSIGICLGIGLLFYFKYLNFFIDSFVIFFNSIGLHSDHYTFNIILPIGISFFTFKLMSYLIEIHRKKMKPITNFIVFATYVVFFPTILSGPIDRPNKFIPQLLQKRTFNYELAKEGLKLIFWGMLMKMCIADRIAIYNNAVFNNITHHNGFTILIVTLFYPIQTYADFAGYSDMAIGVGKLLGFDIMKNFDCPFFSRNIAEYWRKWHMTLTGWLTDYVFMPLNIKFRNMGSWGSELAILITFVLIGLWHGASWTFVLFGLYHGLLYIPLILSGRFFKNKKIKVGKWRLPNINNVPQMLLTYILVAFGLIIFKSLTMSSLINILSGLFSTWGSLFIDYTSLCFIIMGIIILLIHDLHKAFNFLPFLSKVPTILSVVFYIFIIIIAGVFGDEQFIYFQF